MFTFVLPVIVIALWVLVRLAKQIGNEETETATEMETSESDTEQSETEQPESDTEDEQSEQESEPETEDEQPESESVAVSENAACLMKDGEEGCRFMKIFDALIDEYSKVIPRLKDSSNTKTYLTKIFAEAYAMTSASSSFGDFIYKRENFPELINLYGDAVNVYVIEQMGAMVFYGVLAEVMPARRQELAQVALTYGMPIRQQPIYGWTFHSDPNIARIIALIVTRTQRQAKLIPSLRRELGSEMVSYEKDINELFLDLSQLMPVAPGPYLNQYAEREKPVGKLMEDDNLLEDTMTDDYVKAFFSLDLKGNLWQQTVQAIADKEHRAVHLFGGRREVTDPKYGQMSFDPVFGKHNLGVEIPTDGAIAALADAVGMACSNNRKSVLNAQYGRRRPGQGEDDPSAAADVKRRALVNEPIENGDGHSTGHYDKNGDYVFDDGTHVGNYETYYQNQLYANSYPSGHSAYIGGITMAMVEVMAGDTDALMQAMGNFRLSRVITRYHHMSDTTIGLLCGMMFIPVMAGCKNANYDTLLEKAYKEYEALKSGTQPAPSPTPTDRVNTSLAYSIGGYGSCHVDAGEKHLTHCCNKEAKTDRHPSITVSQRVNFEIEGAGVTTADGKISGVWESGVAYYLNCPAVADGEEKTATITMRNEHGVRVLYYKLSWSGTHDDGPGER